VYTTAERVIALVLRDRHPACTLLLSASFYYHVSASLYLLSVHYCIPDGGCMRRQHACTMRRQRAGSAPAPCSCCWLCVPPGHPVCVYYQGTWLCTTRAPVCVLPGHLFVYYQGTWLWPTVWCTVCIVCTATCLCVLPSQLPHHKCCHALGTCCRCPACSDHQACMATLQFNCESSTTAKKKKKLKAVLLLSEHSFSEHSRCGRSCWSLVEMEVAVSQARTAGRT
jgi:hypothetical protein